jgi:hypothetical protein
VAERCCGLKAGEVLLSVLEKLVKTPRLFQDWVSQRSVAPRDLAILNSFESFHLVEPILLTIVQLGLTRSQGVQALEKALELFLMQKPLSEILTAANNAESWLQSLEQNRKPLSWQRQTQAQTKWASLPWPAYVQAKWMRQGDQGQIEVKFHFSSSADFKRKLEALGLVQAALESDKTP